MTILPGLEHLKEELTPTQYRSLVSVRLLLILLYLTLLTLCIVNIWLILILNKKYKTKPMLLFYIFAFLAIVFRLLACIWQFTGKSWVIFVLFS